MRQPDDFRFANFVVLAPLAAGTMQVFLLTVLRLKRIMLLFTIVLLPAAQLRADDLKPVLIDSNGQAKNLSSETVREIFFMRLSSWPDGSPIHVFVLPDSNPLHARFSKEILGVYPFQLRSA